MPDLALHAAQSDLVALLTKDGTPAWLTGGIGLTRIAQGQGDPDALYVGVLKLTPSVRAAIPRKLNGFHIVVRAVGRVRPL
jgi:hypothetical protein